jgi:hypothetical protein
MENDRLTLVPISKVVRSGNIGSKANIYRLLARGAIKAKKMGDCTMIIMESVAAFQQSLPNYVPGQTRVKRRVST